jgi:hypothetical protein
MMRENLERETLGGNGTTRDKVRERNLGKGAHNGEEDSHRGDQRLKKMLSSTTSFYFTQFPKGTGHSVLWKTFTGFGNLGEVFIPNKLDRWGRSFGFVRFKDVTEVEEMERRLEEVWVGDCRLKVNRARFDREEKQGAEPSKQMVRPETSLVQEGRSFRNVLVVADCSLEGNPMVRPILVVESSVDRLEELQSCFVGELTFFREVAVVQHSLELEGFQKIKVASMGDKLVLLQSEVPSVIERARAEKDIWWKATFKEVKRRVPPLVAKSRRVWLRIFGIPLHIWDEPFLRCWALSMVFFSILMRTLSWQED